jgi:ATP-binding cassette subfamily C exporter for protease/lipase
MLSDRHTTFAYRRALGTLRRGLIAAAALSAVISVLMLTGSVYMLQVYDRVLSSGSGATLVALFGIVVVLYAFLTLYDAQRMRLMSRLALGLDAQLAEAAFRADLRGAARPEGASGLTRDLETLRGFIGGPAMLALFDLPFTVVFVGALFLIHPALGWITLGGMGLAAGLAVINRAVLARPMADAQSADGQERRLSEQARRTAPMMAALGMTGAITARWLGLHARALKHHQKGTEPSEVLTALSRSLRMLLQAVLLTAGAWLAIQGTMSAGAIVAASILSGRALGPVDQLIGQWRGVTAALMAHKSLGTGLEQAPDAAAVTLPPLTGALEVTGLTALAPAPDGAERRVVLNAVSFRLTPGEGLGIVGASASGKSTLARLIVGALSPDKGEVRFDGATRHAWAEGALNRQIGYLPQRIDLLPGSLRDNIARFDPDATDAGVIAAAQAAGIHDMILHLPEGYATDLTQADVPLSGGQIQRLGLARALYGNPRILVLDEPNAHLDMAGEAALVRTLAGLREQGVTIIVLAHRAGALAATDRLMVLQDGAVVQDGPRDAVLAVLGAAKPPAAAPAMAHAPAANIADSPEPVKARLRITLPKPGDARLRGVAAAPPPLPLMQQVDATRRAHAPKPA